MLFSCAWIRSPLELHDVLGTFGEGIFHLWTVGRKSRPDHVELGLWYRANYANMSQHGLLWNSIISANNQVIDFRFFFFFRSVSDETRV